MSDNENNKNLFKLEDFIKNKMGNDKKEISSETILSWIEEHKEYLKVNPLTISLQDWDYTCGDGCCYEYGTYLNLNNKRLANKNGDETHCGYDVQNALECVLTEIGYDVLFNYDEI